MNEDVTVTYLHVEDGVVVNRVLGTSTYKQDNWVSDVDGPISLNTVVGSKFSEQHKTFLPPGMTDEEAQEILEDFSQKLEDVLKNRKEFVTTEHFENNLVEEIKNNFLWQIKELEMLKQKSQENPIWLILNNEKRDIIFHEPLNIKPNLENEV